MHVLTSQHIRAFFEHMQQVQGDTGGLTRDYLAACIEIDAYHDVILGCAICYLSIYLPVIGRLEHIEGRKALNEHDIRVYTLLTQLSNDPLPLLTAGRVCIYDGQKPHRLLSDVLLENVWVKARGGAACGSVAREEVLEVLRIICRALAANYHHYHIEHMVAPHAQPTDADYEEKLEQFKKRGGGSAHTLTDEELERIHEAPNTSKMSESTFGRLRYIREGGVTRKVDTICGLTMIHFNHTGKFLIDWLLEPGNEELAERVYAMVKALHTTRRAVVGNCAQQALQRGLDRKLIDDAIIAKHEEAAARRQAELDKLLKARAELGERPSWDALKSFAAARGNDGLLDLCRAMKRIDKADLQLTEHSSKYLRLKLLVKHYELTATDAEIREAAALKKKRTAGAPRRRDAQGLWEVERIVAARTTAGVREYCVRWAGYDEEDDEWVTFDKLCGRSAGEVVMPHADIEAQIAELDAVHDEELPVVLLMDRAVHAAQTCALSAGMPVLVAQEYDEEEVWRVGKVNAVVDGQTASVVFDREEAVTLARADVFAAPAAVSGSHRVRVPYACELCDSQSLGKRWWYGSARAVDGSSGLLLRVEFDNGEVLDSVPAFHVELLVERSSQGPSRKRPRAVER